jgi:hypothetical protein
MTTGFRDFDIKIHDLVERENECDDLFEEIKNGNGENSLRYLALRDSCKELRKDIFRSAMSAGLTRERIKTEIKEAKNQTPPLTRSRLRKNQSTPGFSANLVQELK